MEKQAVSYKTFFIVLLAAALFLTSCAKQEDLGPDSATTKNDVYTNHFFDFSLRLPAGWYSLDRKGMEAKSARAEEALTGKKETSRDRGPQKTAPLSSVNLFFVAQNPPEENPTLFNPSISCVAEKVPQNQGVVTGRTYLESVRKILGAGRFPVTLPQAITPVLLGGEEFFLLRAEIPRGALTIKQEYYASVRKGYALALVKSFATAAQEKTMNQVFRSLRFHEQDAP